jgi:ketosteroid isomerase-like protein
VGQNADALKAGWDAFARGDLDAVKEYWHDDIEWENPHWERAPVPGVVRGKDAIIDMFGEVLGEWDDVDMGPDEFIEQGDTVVLLAHFKGKSKQTGRTVELPYVYIWRMRDGKAVRCQFLTDTGLGAEAAGRI